MMEKFHYTTAAGEKITLTRPDQLPMRALFAAQDAPGGAETLAGTRAMIKYAADEENYEKLLDLTGNEFGELMTAWGDAPGGTVGESSTSAKR